MDILPVQKIPNRLGGGRIMRSNGVAFSRSEVGLRERRRLGEAIISMFQRRRPRRVGVAGSCDRDVHAVGNASGAVSSSAMHYVAWAGVSHSRGMLGIEGGMMAAGVLGPGSPPRRRTLVGEAAASPVSSTALLPLGI